MSKYEVLHEMYTICQHIDFTDTIDLLKKAETEDEKTFFSIVTDCILQQKQKKAVSENRF